MRNIRLIAVAAAGLTAAAAAPRGAERWTAVSKTAMAITGDITLSPTRLVMAGKALKLTPARDVPAFGTGTDGPQPARVLRVTVPSDPMLLHGNTLCGGAAVRWIALYRTDAGRSLKMAVFSGSAPPVAEDDAGLCGTYLYVRDTRR